MSSFETYSFYRGLSKNYEISHPTVHFTRKNRRPRDMHNELHEFADNWFLSTFGVRYRSEAIFLSSDIAVAAAYASSPEHIGRIIPLGHYSYCWSSQLTDLLQICLQGPDIGNFNNDLIEANYKETGLAEAHRLGHEVMLTCDSYICIPINCHIQRHD